EKLDHFTAVILAEATQETEHALAQLSAKRDAARSAAENQVLTETYQYIRSEVARIRSEAGRRVSRHMLENKRTLYLRREEIAREVFALVQDKLIAYTLTPAYPERLKAIYRQAAETLRGAEILLVYLRPGDMDLAPALAAQCPEVRAEFRVAGFPYGGLIAEAPSLGKRVDSTFSTGMQELDGHFAEIFGLSLSDNLGEEENA
ncbi:MAG: V-type ATP synthase subunit E, partial [Pseudoflavonifractor sp.]